MDLKSSKTIFFEDLKAIYRESVRSALMLPLLFLLPGLVELGQHIVEYQTGFYDSFESARSSAADPSRMVWGFAKALSIALPSYWLIRLIASGDRGFAQRLEWPAIGLWFAIFVVGGLQIWYSLFGPALATGTGLAERSSQVITGSLGVIFTALSIYLTVMIVAWPLGRSDIGPNASIHAMIGRFWITLAYTVAGFLPLTIVHYALGYGAVTAPSILKWPMLLIDAVVVALLACTMAAATYYAAYRAAAAKGLDIFPEP